MVAATLLDLKAARLLPAGEVHDDEDLALLEVRDLLFARLLQYRAFKHVAELFAELEAAALRSYPRAVSLEDRFAELLPEVHARGRRRQLRPDRRDGVHPAPGADGRHRPPARCHAVSVPEQAGRLLALLERSRGSAQWATFADWWPTATVAIEIVGRFLALLELYRAQGGSIRATRTAWCAPGFVDRGSADQRTPGNRDAVEERDDD